MLGLAGRDGEAAIADDCSGDSQRRRRAHVRVPSDLRVEMGVAVDDAGHQRQPVCGNYVMRCPGNVATDVLDHAIVHDYVVHRWRMPAAIEDQCILEQKIAHRNRGWRVLELQNVL